MSSTAGTGGPDGGPPEGTASTRRSESDPCTNESAAGSTAGPHLEPHQWHCTAAHIGTATPTSSTQQHTSISNTGSQRHFY
jgi:hypothetical protein